MQKRDFFIFVNTQHLYTKVLSENLTIFGNVKKSDNFILYFNGRSYVTYVCVGEEFCSEQKRKQRNSCLPPPEFY